MDHMVRGHPGRAVPAAVDACAPVAATVRLRRPGAGAVVARGWSRPRETAEDMLTYVRGEVPLAGAAEGEELAMLRAHCREHVDTFLSVVETGRPPTGSAIEFVRRLAETGARDRVELEVLLRGYRSNARIITHWVGEQASAATGEGLRAALAVTRMVMEYTDSISGALAEACAGHSSAGGEGGVGCASAGARRPGERALEACR